MKRPTKTREVLDRAVLEQLLLAGSPLSPAPDRAAAIKQRVLETVRREDPQATGDHVTVRSEAGAWMAFGSQVQIKMLHSDGRYHSVLLRMAPGASLPAHSHGDDEECMVLEGEAYLGDIRVKAGDYHLAPKGSHHGEIRSDTGALLFLRTTQEFSRRAGRQR